MILTRLLCLLGCTAYSLARAGWMLDTIVEPLDDSTLAQEQSEPLLLQLSTPSLCALDRLSLTWSAPKTFSVDNLYLAVVRRGGREAYVMSMTDTAHTQPPTNTNTSGLIRCQLNEAHCAAAVHSLVALPEAAGQIAVLFHQETDQPPLLDLDALLDALDFTPPLHPLHPAEAGAGAEAAAADSIYAQWVTPSRLEIHTGGAYIRTVLQAHAAGALIEITPRGRIRSPSTGSANLRPTEHGTFEVFIARRGENGLSQVRGPGAPARLSFRVDLCADAEVLLMPPVPAPNAGTEAEEGEGEGAGAAGARTGATELSGARLPSVKPALKWVDKRVVRVRGTGAVTGQHSLNLHSSSVTAFVRTVRRVSCVVIQGRLPHLPTALFRLIFRPTFFFSPSSFPTFTCSLFPPLCSSVDVPCSPVLLCPSAVVPYCTMLSGHWLLDPLPLAAPGPAPHRPAPRAALQGLL